MLFFQIVMHKHTYCQTYIYKYMPIGMVYLQIYICDNHSSISQKEFANFQLVHSFCLRVPTRRYFQTFFYLNFVAHTSAYIHTFVHMYSHVSFSIHSPSYQICIDAIFNKLTAHFDRFSSNMQYSVSEKYANKNLFTQCLIFFTKKYLQGKQYLRAFPVA